ncbi:flavin reductase family protein [Nocardiopsis dassonvillei]|uniref:flavin reductase family protein n=1 Tax=Nocardiopsis dassonvillei TaxID=2014 RepID=UPI0036F57351
MTPVPADTVRDALAALPTAVTVVTTRGPDGPAGCTASAVTLVCPSPPTLLVCLRDTSATLTALREAGVFAVNVLAWHDRHLAARFATAPAGERFAGIDGRDVDGVPVLPRSALLLTCSVRECVPVAGHRLVVGSVLSVERSGLAPTVQYERAHRELARARPPHPATR